jgi:SAM-dependent methyltransferase
MRAVGPGIPNVARMYDYYLGGREAHEVDRQAAERVLASAPQVHQAVAENRGFLERVVARLVELGIDQFLDLGSGLPTRRNVHEILAERAPGARVVYVDYDPEVVSRGRELVATAGNAIYVEGDVRELPALCRRPEVRTFLDFERPLGVLMLAVLNFVGDEDDPARIVAGLRRLTAPGSFLALSHGAREPCPEAAEGIERAYQRASGQAVLRTRAEIMALLGGCEVLPPGVVYGAQWAAAGALSDPGTAMTLAALARL